MSLTFEWDPRKAASNWRKHRVTFEEASTVFGDWYSVATPDPDHSFSEERNIIVGRSRRGRLLIVSFLERADKLRIISARTLTPQERRQYEEAED